MRRPGAVATLAAGICLCGKGLPMHALLIALLMQLVAGVAQIVLDVAIIRAGLWPRRDGKQEEHEADRAGHLASG